MPLMSPLRVLGSYLKEHLLMIFSGVTNFKFQSYISNQEY